MSDVSKILERIRRGEQEASRDLLSLVYDELRRMARAQARNQPPGATLNPTALVHEAWLRLVPDTEMPVWNCRGHFFMAAAEAMRRVLIDAARKRYAVKRGGGRERMDFLSVEPSVDSEEQVLLIDDALTRLALDKPQVVQLVKLRYFVGLKIDEAAEILEISPRTAKNWWAYAKAWLHSELKEN
jgi:RNA polymerase sigma factor (TIGR02999 family)